MNDITPPKPAKQDTQDNPVLVSNTVKTNVQPDIKTNVGRPIRHWGKWLVLALVVLTLMVASLYGFQRWSNANRTYKVGTKVVRQSDFTAQKEALNRSRGGKDAPGGSSASLKEAEDRVLMLAALQTEADKQNISYNKSDIDTYMSKTYAEQGGKAGYIAYMKSAFNWSEEEMYQYRTMEYLKEKLQKTLLQDKSFTAVYFRWDVLKERDEQNFAANLATKKGVLDTKFRDFLNSPMTLLDVSLQTDFPMGTPREKQSEIFEKTDYNPITAQLENPGITEYSVSPHKEGSDPKVFFASAKKKGSIIGPEVLSDGRTVIARLDDTGIGAYESWDAFLVAVRKNAGISVTQPPTLGVGESKAFSYLLGKLKGVLPAAAEASGAYIHCYGHNINYTFYTKVYGTGATLNGGPFQALANRDMSVCYENEYPAGTLSSSSYGSSWRLVTIGVWGTTGSIGLDCVGEDWQIWAPTVPGGYTYRSREDSLPYTNNNGKSISVTWWYNPPAAQPPPPPPSGPDPYCTFTDAHRVDATRWSVSWASYNYFGTSLTGSLQNSVSGGTDNSVELSETDHKVQVADGKTGVVKFTIFNNGSPTSITCSTNVGNSTSNPPPNQPPPPPNQPPPSPPTFSCNAAPLTSDSDLNPWVAAFDTIPRGSVLPPPSSITVERGQPVYVLGYIQKGMNPRIPGYVYKWTIDPSTNTQGPNLKSGYIDNKAFVSFKVALPNEDGIETYTLKADVNSEAGGIIESSCSVKISVKSKPLAPTANPWLQAKRGNVLALGYIQSQLVGSAAGRPATSPDKEAEHVIIGYLGSTVKDSNFCSTRGYDFGTVTANKCQYNNAGGSGYAAKVPSGIGIAASDPAIRSLDVAVTGRNGLAVDTCNDKVPYKLNNLGTANTTALGDLGASNECPMVVYAEPASGTLDLTGNTSITQGRGTLYVKGNVTINGNISYNYGFGRFSSINTIPNLGIVATGNILIAPTVTNVDASLYTLGKVKTCSGAYPSAACNVKLTIRGKLAAVNGFELGRSYWTGNPADTTNPTSPESAELVIGSGLLEAFPPPGFVDLTGGLSSVQYLSREANPRF